MPEEVLEASLDTVTPVTERVRVGFAVEAVVQPAWIARSIEAVRALPSVDLQVILVTGRQVFGPSIPEEARDLYDTFSARELRRLPTPFGDPYAPVDLSADHELAPGTILTLHLDRSAVRVPGSVAPDELAHLDLDVLICPSASAVPRDLLSMPRHGAWGFEGTTDRRRSAIQAFWNVMNRAPQTDVELYRFNVDGTIAGTVVSAPCRSILGSPLVTEVRNRWKCPALLTQALTHLHVHGVSPGTDVVPAHPPAPPANREMAYLWLRHTLRLSRLRALAEVARPQWFMHYHFSKAGGSAPERPALDFRRFEALETPPDRIWADPFPVSRDGRHFVLFEEKLDSEPYGHISVMELSPSGPVSAPRTVLVRPHHLSYPFIFEWNGETYMMPESHDIARLEVYRAVRFPDEWELVTVALHEALADATIAEIDGTWWMFAARQAAPLLDCDELVLYHAPTPLGPWTPHAANPVFSDVRSARPAGRLYRTEDGWIRPAQDGVRGYGHSMRLMRIAKLTADEYREELVQVLPPDWARRVHGNHTLNADNGLTTIDAVRFIRKRGHPRIAMSSMAPFILGFPGA